MIAAPELFRPKVLDLTEDSGDIVIWLDTNGHTMRVRLEPGELKRLIDIAFEKFGED